MSSVIVNGDARHIPLADKSVQCVVTSPPYYGLRDYGIAGQIGLEPSPAEYVAQMVQVFDEVRRVLRDDGVCWLNLGDSYANDDKWGGTTSGKHAHGLHGEPVGRTKRNTGLKAKNLIGIPWRVAFALQDAGWYLRSDIIWSKSNPMPESVTDRPTRAHEYLFLLTKSARYFYDAEAIKTPPKEIGWETRKDRADVSHKSMPDPMKNGMRPRTDKQRGHSRRHDGFNDRWDAMPKAEQQSKFANARSVWEIATKPFSGAHFATMPAELARRCIAAGTSERGCCSCCGAPYTRIVDRESSWPARKETGATAGNVGVSNDYQNGIHGGVKHHNLGGFSSTKGWQPTCECDAGDPVPCVVLDPFNGSGTTGMVALRMGRRYVGVELNPDYIALAHERQTVTMGMGW